MYLKNEIKVWIIIIIWQTYVGPSSAYIEGPLQTDLGDNGSGSHNSYKGLEFIDIIDSRKAITFTVWILRLLGALKESLEISLHY